MKTLIKLFILGVTIGLVFALGRMVFSDISRVGATYNEDCERVCIEHEWVKTTCKFKISHSCIVWNYEWQCTSWENQCVEPTPTVTPTPYEEECNECEEEITPTPTPEVVVNVEDGNYDDTRNMPNACTAKSPNTLPLNPLVWRRGGTAIVQWQPTEGDKANVYYYQNQNRLNAHAVRDTENDGYVEINELGNLDWTFGIQQSNDCAGDAIVWIEDGGTNGWTLFLP